MENLCDIRSALISQAQIRKEWWRSHRMPCMRRFVGVAAQWAAALLDQADQERQGVDLFGRDALVLGHVLATLVCCPACPASRDYHRSLPSQLCQREDLLHLTSLSLSA